MKTTSKTDNSDQELMTNMRLKTKELTKIKKVTDA